MDTLTRLAALLHEAGDLVASLAHAEPSAPGERLLTQRDAAERLHLSHQRVGELARQGILKGRKVGRYWRFPVEALAAFAHATEPVPTAPRGRIAPPVKPLAAASRKLRRLRRGA
jgi:excisionase family DNA binding protein